MSTLEQSSSGLSKPEFVGQTSHQLRARENVTDKRTNRSLRGWAGKSAAAATLVFALGSTAACEPKDYQTPSFPNNSISDITPSPSHTVVIPHLTPGQKNPGGIPPFTHH